MKTILNQRPGRQINQDSKTIAALAKVLGTVFCLAGALCLVPAARAQSTSYQIVLRPGWNVIANQLSTGGNTLPEVLPSVPAFSTLYLWDANTQTYSSSIFDPDDGGWSVPSMTLRPGDGGFLYNPNSAPFPLIFAGETVTPHLPLNLPYDEQVLAARQIPAPATYEQITGLPPSEGTKLYRYDSTLQGHPFELSNWTAYTFSQGIWTPSTPNVSVGEAVFIKVPTVANQPPVLAETPDQTAHAGATLRFTIPAVDPDGPSNLLRYSLDSGPPGASIDPVTGEFTWQSHLSDVGTTNPVVVRVSESGTPALSAIKAFSIVVVDPPRFRSATLTEAGMELAWDAIAGNAYRIEVCRDLGLNSWQEVDSNLTAAENEATWTISDVSTMDQGFYRLVDLAVPAISYLTCTTTTTNGPRWTCCERKIRFPKEAFKIGKAGRTYTFNGGTQRSVEVDLTVPILFECANVQTQKCVADIAVAVKGTPKQLDSAKNEYTIEPVAQTLKTTINNAPPNCDGQPHQTTVTITWTGDYPGVAQVKGLLVLELTVRADKGTIKHLIGVEVKGATGSSCPLGDPKLEAE